MIFAVLERACENDECMMNKIWVEGNTYVNHLIKLLVSNDLNDTRIRNGKTMSLFSERTEFKFSKVILTGIGIFEMRRFNILSDEVKIAMPATYYLVCKITRVPCRSISAAAQGKELLPGLTENNQLKASIEWRNYETESHTRRGNISSDLLKDKERIAR